MSFYKTTFYVGIAAFILMAVNSEAMTQVQHWVTHLSVNHYHPQSTSEKRNTASVTNRVPGIVKVTSVRLENHQNSISSHHRPKLNDASLKPTIKPQPIPKAAPLKFKSQTVATSLPSVVKPERLLNDTTSSKTYPVKQENHNLAKKEVDESVVTLPELVVYPDEIVIAFPKKLASTENIQKVVSRILLSNAPLSESNLLKTQQIDLKQRPYFYRRVLDQHKAPVRYPMQAFKYADYLIENHIEEHQDEAGAFITLHIPLVEYGMSGPAKNYQAWVENYAKEYKVPPSLIYAVMETESAFNPKAVSRSNAIGLMQVKADAAGKDVYQLIDAKPGQPSASELFDSKSNIRMGTAYLGLLKHDYLAAIQDERIKQMVTISSYNGGLSTVLGLFGKTPESAAKQLNRMSPKQVYRKLRFEHQSDETRRYLDKVLKAEIKYRDLLKAV